MKNNIKTIIHIALAVLILMIGIFLMLAMKKLRKPPQQSDNKVLAPLVEVKSIDPCDMQMVISGFGTVNARLEVEIVPQVTGNVIEVHPQFKAGGFIPAGETIIKIDPRDYELTVKQARAAIQQAKVQLQIEVAESKVAREEWDQLNPGVEPESPLVLRGPQIQQARADLESAKAKLETAKLNLERTNVTMPIDLYISSESIDLGQLAKTGSTIGSAFGTKKAEVKVPLEDKELAWFSVPAMSASFNGNNSGIGSRAFVYANLAGKRHKWLGNVTRTTGQIDQKSRLITVVIEIDDPLSTPGNPPLLPGTFVEVEILGEKVSGFYKIPREAIRKADNIWIAEDGQMNIKDIKIKRSDEEFVYTDEGLMPGENIVITPLDAVIDGMKIRYEGYDDPNMTEANAGEVE